MANCLVTKLNESVQNDNLLKLGEFRYKVLSDKTYVPLGTIQAQTISVISGNLTINGGTEYLLNAEFPPETLVGTGVISSLNKYAISALRGDKNNMNTSELKTLPSLRNFVYEATEGFDISEIDYLKDNSALTQLRIICSNYNFTGNISAFRDVKYSNTIESLSIENSSTVGLTGDFKYLGCLANCSSYGTTVTRTSIAGSIEDFVAIKRGRGKTTGSVTFSYLGDNGLITFEGSAVQNAQNNTIAWTDSTITYNGTTIQNSAVIII